MLQCSHQDPSRLGSRGVSALARRTGARSWRGSARPGAHPPSRRSRRSSGEGRDSQQERPRPSPIATMSQTTAAIPATSTMLAVSFARLSWTRVPTMANQGVDRPNLPAARIVTDHHCRAERAGRGGRRAVPRDVQRRGGRAGGGQADPGPPEGPGRGDPTDFGDHVRRDGFEAFGDADRPRAK